MIKFIQILLFLSSAAGGLFFFLKPALAIEMQRRFYAWFNWRVEPISMKRELLTVKIVGILLLAFAIFSMLFCCSIGEKIFLNK
jgi:hypothetical protein